MHSNLLHPPQLYWLIAAAALLLILVFVPLFFLFRKKPSAPISPLTEGLKKSQSSLASRLGEALGRRQKIDADLFSELEDILITSDVGVQTTKKLLSSLVEKIKASGSDDLRLLKQHLKQEILDILTFPEKAKTQALPQVWMMVGVNGVGKTTTIGKLAKRFRAKGQKVLLAAGDTFRAGAIEQLRVWAERVDAPIIAQQEGSDPAAVAFDAVKSGTAKGMDLVIIDTAGRLHTKTNLMEEMKKIRRVIDKALPGAPHEAWIVVDATTGQNALNQAREFHEIVKLTGVILTKLDGTAKGGIIIAICDELKIPVRYVGLGEKVDDLKEFHPKDFIEALVG